MHTLLDTIRASTHSCFALYPLIVQYFLAWFGSQLGTALVIHFG